MKKIFFILMMFSSCTTTMYSQTLPVTTKQQLEDLAETTEEELNDDQHMQQLVQLKKHPVQLNLAQTEDLQSLYFLSPLQIDHFIKYRNTMGNLLDIYELQAIPSWDLITIQKILPYITIHQNIPLKENLLSRFKGEQNIFIRISRVLENSKEYDSSTAGHYLGDKNHLFLRYRYQYKNLMSFGLTADKDAGEPFFNKTRKTGFDFYGYHFFLRDLGKLKALAIGDFTINMGQGLIQWQSMGFGKSSETMSIKKQSPVLMPYRSAGEYNFNRGIAFTIGKKKIETTLFLSHKKISGTVEPDSIILFSGISVSGYHRTASEISNRNQIKQSSIGGNFSYRFSGIKIGVNALLHQFNIPLQKKEVPYNLYALNGNRFWNAGIDYSYTLKNMHGFGEISIDKSYHRAILNGLLISPDPVLDISLVHRNIQKGYGALMGNAFTENSRVENEYGLYLGMSIHPGAGWQINAFADLFQFPWLKFRVNAPSYGHDYLFQINYQLRKKFQLYLRYRNKSKELNHPHNIINSPLPQVRQSFRFHFSTLTQHSISVNSRWEMVWINKGREDSEEGFLTYVEFGWKGFRGIQADLRLQCFETEGFNSRIYAFESDVLYNYSIPAFFDKGLNYYLNLNYDIHKNFTIWFKWKQTISASGNRSDSAFNEFSKTKKSEVKLQLGYFF